MAISGTYIGLQRQIVDEIGDRSDLLQPLLTSATNSPVKQAIQSAIARWEREPFYFTETYSPLEIFATVVGQERYDSTDEAEIASNASIMTLRIIVGTDRHILRRQSWDYLEGISVSSTARGQPTDWAYYDRQIRLYPIPDAVYSIRGSRTAKLTALSADADANVWTTEAYDLIRCEAKLHIARNFLHDQKLAAECEMQIYGNPMNPRDKGVLGALKAESTRRAKSRIKPTQL